MVVGGSSLEVDPLSLVFSVGCKSSLRRIFFLSLGMRDAITLLIIILKKKNVMIHSPLELKEGFLIVRIPPSS
jgi:hypothetical protein